LIASNTCICEGGRYKASDAVAAESYSCASVITVVDGTKLNAGVVENFEAKFALVACGCSSSSVGLAVNATVDSTVSQADT
jgi:hypothetical protein